MSIGIPSLVLSSFPQKNKRLLVRATDAIRLCREGSYEPLSRHEASRVLMMRQPAEARDFVAKAGVLSRTVADCPDLPLLAELQALIAAGALVAVRESEGKASPATPSLVKQRRVLAALATAKPEAMRFKGGIYRLLTDADFKRIQDDLEDYTVVNRADAVEVLTGLAESASAARARLFTDAAELLTQDWRPPLSPDGLILLKRRITARITEHSAGPTEKARQSAGAQSAAPQEESEPKRPCEVALANASASGAPFCDTCTHP